MAVVTVTVKTVPTRLLVANDKRKVYSIHNDSTVNVYVGYDKEVATSGPKRGILVRPNGGAIEDEFHKGEVWAIAEAETEVTVVEVSEGE